MHPEIEVMISGGFSAVYRVLVPDFERATGNKVTTAFGSSMGTTHDAIPLRVARGEPGDVLIMVGYALDNLIKQGKVAADGRVDLARSSIGMAVRAGAPRPDIGSVDALKRTLLAAESIAYSDSASGAYVGTDLFQRLGVADEMKGKSRMILVEPVGQVVARGEAEIGFQQISELLPVRGIDLVGALPPEVKKITVFSAGIATTAQEPAGAKALIQFLSSPAAAPVLIKGGLEPMAAAERT